MFICYYLLIMHRKRSKKWHMDYNDFLQHNSLENKTPNEFAMRLTISKIFYTIIILRGENITLAVSKQNKLEVDKT